MQNEVHNELNAIATLRKVNVVKLLVDRYQKDKRKKLLVKDVDVKFCTKFEEYCYETFVGRGIRSFL
ncbi:phage integrase SAM-like domain-containing protein [Myroides odoratus]|uniref:phage integrase SAM-like domain-containing protein n=1 Tax=Myroides odoratus TaxID=256 RepID=UPI0039AF09B0